MQTRILPPADYARLRETENAIGAPPLPEGVHVIVVEDRDSIIGCVALFPVLHADGLWIRADHRGRAAVMRHLWPTLRVVARQSFSATAVVATCGTATGRRVLEHLGARPLADHYLLPLEVP